VPRRTASIEELARAEAVFIVEGRSDMTTETNNAATPATTDTKTEDSLLEQAKEVLTGAGDAISDAFEDVVDAAKKNPVAAAAIAAGAAAAVAGAAFGVSKLLDKDDDK
jgi:ABC-type enterobactin transport system permease subunit